MAPDSRPHRRRRSGAAFHPLDRVTGRPAWWRRWWRPAFRAAVSVAPLTITPALVAGHVAAVLSGLAVAALAVLLARGHRAGQRVAADAAAAAAAEHAERCCRRSTTNGSATRCGAENASWTRGAAPTGSEATPIRRYGRTTYRHGGNVHDNALQPALRGDGPAVRSTRKASWWSADGAQGRHRPSRGPGEGCSRRLGLRRCWPG